MTKLDELEREVRTKEINVANKYSAWQNTVKFSQGAAEQDLARRGALKASEELEDAQDVYQEELLVHAGPLTHVSMAIL